MGLNLTDKEHRAPYRDKQAIDDIIDEYFRNMSGCKRFVIILGVIALWTLAIVVAFYFGWNIGEQIQ